MAPLHGGAYVNIFSHYRYSTTDTIPNFVRLLCKGHLRRAKRKATHTGTRDPTLLVPPSPSCTAPTSAMDPTPRLLRCATQLCTGSPLPMHAAATTCLSCGSMPNNSEESASRQPRASKSVDCVRLRLTAYDIDLKSTPATMCTVFLQELPITVRYHHHCFKLTSTVQYTVIIRVILIPRPIFNDHPYPVLLSKPSLMLKHLVLESPEYSTHLTSSLGLTGAVVLVVYKTTVVVVYYCRV
jgi:hypothetical protein